MEVLARVLDKRLDHLTVITANWAVARETSTLGTMRRMFSRLLEQAEEVATDSANHDDGLLLQLLSEAQPAERQQLLISHLQELVARVLQLDASQFSGQESLTSLGL